MYIILGRGPAARFAQVIVPILYLSEFRCCFEGFAHPDLVSGLVRDVGTRGGVKLPAAAGCLHGARHRKARGKLESTSSSILCILQHSF